MVLDPIIPEKDLVMLYAARGTGKTHVALDIAYAVATGGSFLKWQAPKPRRVLLVDGKMPASAFRSLPCTASCGGCARTPRGTDRVGPLGQLSHCRTDVFGACPAIPVPGEGTRDIASPSRRRGQGALLCRDPDAPKECLDLLMQIRDDRQSAHGVGLLQQRFPYILGDV
jgi:hypothetical protein